jgi:hypothetical protein
VGQVAISVLLFVPAIMRAPKRPPLTPLGLVLLRFDASQSAFASEGAVSVAPSEGRGINLPRSERLKLCGAAGLPEIDFLAVQTMICPGRTSIFGITLPPTYADEP